MDHKYKALLQNIPTRHVITAIAKPADRPQQIAKLRNLDINNFFILGSLQSIRDVLGESKFDLLTVSIRLYIEFIGNDFYSSPQIRPGMNIFNAISLGMQSPNIRAN